MAGDDNPLIDDRDADFLLHEVLDVTRLCDLPYFADHDRETFELVLAGARRMARKQLFPAYAALDTEPPAFRDGRVQAHPTMHTLLTRMRELDLIAAARPVQVGGQQLPLTIMQLAAAYLMAANLSAYGYLGLTTGAAHLIEAFGSEALKREYMDRLYRGEWLGTMALTEPQAGSSLSDVETTAIPTDHGHHLIRGSKIFISGGDHDLTDNIVHMTLARIAGAPAGIKGVSLFLVPKRRPGGGGLVDNDVNVTGVIHKIGWRGLPSVALSYGENDDCHGWLVGEPHRGIAYMFQMMNEARIMVGMNGVATASVAYHEALAYARTRPQGRPAGSKDPRTPQVPIIEHVDVRRMLLRQKAIVEGGLALLLRTSLYADLAEHGPEHERARAQLLLDLLTPVAKSFPAERGFEANVLAVQIHGGYGYSSEYPVEAWLRDAKLNSIHEGTTGIHGLDLLGRRALAGGGAALSALAGEIRASGKRAAEAGCRTEWVEAVDRAVDLVTELTATLASRAGERGPEALLLHSADYLELLGILCVAWQWLDMARAAHTGLAGAPGAERAGFYQGKLCAAQYWLATELPRIDHLATLCRDGEDSYARLRPEWL